MLLRVYVRAQPVHVLCSCSSTLLSICWSPVCWSVQVWVAVCRAQRFRGFAVPLGSAGLQHVVNMVQCDVSVCGLAELKQLAARQIWIGSKG